MVVIWLGIRFPAGRGEAANRLGAEHVLEGSTIQCTGITGITVIIERLP